MADNGLVKKKAEEAKPKELIWEIMGCKQVKPITGSHGTTPMPYGELLMGLELEIENFPMDDTGFGGINFTQDGSLRNNGMEGITEPMAVKYIPSLLKAFFNKYKIDQKKNYSDRCSTHVHVNVQDLKPDQVVAICLVYQTVERLLFQYVHEDRKNNIYCVPWYQSGLTSDMASNLMNYGPFTTFRRWQKYSALNLIPVQTQGTLEFRHMEGSCDVEYITGWLCLLTKLYEYAVTRGQVVVSEEITNMNTISNYRQWLYEVFGPYADLLMRANDFETQLAKGVVDTKVMLIKPEKLPVKNWTAEYINTTAPGAQFFEYAEARPAPTLEDIRRATEDLRRRVNPAPQRATIRGQRGGL